MKGQGATALIMARSSQLVSPGRDWYVPGHMLLPLESFSVADDCLAPLKAQSSETPFQIRTTLVSQEQ